MKKKITKIEPTKIELPKLKKVAAYARVSVDKGRTMHSFSAQVSFYNNLIQKNPEWEYAGVYADLGISGTDIKNRDEFKRLLDDCEQGKIDIILTKSISRFARNTVDLLNTVRHLKELGIEVRFEKENINSMSGDGELMLSILASFAQEESISISNNVKWGHRKRFADGKVSVPFGNFLGYKKGADGNLEIDEEQAVVVRRIYREYLAGSTACSIAKSLMEDGIESPGHKKKWNASTIRSILKNEKYKGDALLQKHYTVDFLTKKQKVNEGEVQQYYVENNHEAIIDLEVFEMVQTEIERRRNLKGKYSGVDILTAKIICGKCGGSFGSKVWHSNDKYRKVVYQCNQKYNGENKCTTSILIKEDIENRFIKVVNSLIENKDEVIENLETIRKTLCDTTLLLKEKNELSQKLVEQVEQIQELIEVNSRVAQNQEEYQKQYEKLVNEYEITKVEHQKLELDISNKLAKSETLSVFINTIKKQETLLETFDEMMWGSLLESVVVYKDNVLFKFRDGTEIKG